MLLSFGPGLIVKQKTSENSHNKKRHKSIWRNRSLIQFIFPFSYWWRVILLKTHVETETKHHITQGNHLYTASKNVLWILSECNGGTIKITNYKCMLCFSVQSNVQYSPWSQLTPVHCCTPPAIDCVQPSSTLPWSLLQGGLASLSLMIQNILGPN